MIFCRLVNGKWTPCEKEDEGSRGFRQVHQHSVVHLLNLLNFLFWMEREHPSAMWGGVRILDALESCRQLLGFDEEAFEKIERIVLGEITNESLPTTQ